MRRWRHVPVWLALFVYVGGAGLWLSRSDVLRRKRFEAFSVYSNASEGLSVAFAYLEQRKDARKVLTLTRPFNRLPLEEGAVLFRVAPTLRSPEGSPIVLPQGQNPSKKKAQDPVGVFMSGERAWVREGGRLVLAINRNYGAIRVEAVSGSPEVEKVFPLWPGADRLKWSSPRGLKGWPVSGMHAVMTASAYPVIGRMVEGKGEVIVLACPEILQNENLGHADHLRILDALAGKERVVYFDEFVHGVRMDVGMLALLRRWGFGSALLLVALTGLLVYWRKRIRLGPPEDDYREVRSEAIDFVASLASLYDRALYRHQALSHYYDQFRRALSAESGLRGDELERRIQDLTGHWVPPKPHRQRDMAEKDFKQSLGILNRAFRRFEHVKRD